MFLRESMIYNTNLAICYDYHPFDFQMIFVPNKHKVLIRNQTLSIIFTTPDGLSDYVPSNTILIKGDKIKSFGVQIPDGYLLVLPLAPFKWNVRIKINAIKTELKKGEISLVYYTNQMDKLKEINDNKDEQSNARMYFLLCLLKCMVFIRDQFRLKYVIPLSQEELLIYNKRHLYVIEKYQPSNFYFQKNNPYNCGLFKQTKRSNCNFKVECAEIKSISDIIPWNQISLDLTKSSWSLSDYLYVGDDLGSVESVAAESKDDVSDFKKLVEELKEIVKERYFLSNDIKEKKKECENKQREMESIPFLFFPSKSGVAPSILNELTLTDAIIVLFEENKASICLPNNNFFFLPDSYVEEDGNEISIPYYCASSEVKLVLRSEVCDITQRPNSFLFIMKDNDIGQKKVKIEATVYRLSDNEKLATEEFYLRYERKSIPNRIVTSAPCYLHTAANASDSNILYPTALPIDIVVYRNGSKKQYTVTNDKWKTISTKPLVDVSSSEMKKSSYPLGTIFTWNGNEIMVLKREVSQINQIHISQRANIDAKSIIRNLQSKQLSTFINSLLSLPIALLSASKEEKRMLISILNGCMNNTILPTIRRIAEHISNTAFNSKSLCIWKYCSKKENSEESNENKKAYIHTEENASSSYHKDEVNQMYLNSKNYEAYLEVINKMDMNELFESIYKRRSIIDYVLPKSNRKTVSYEITELRNELISKSVVGAINSASIKIIELLKGKSCMNRKPHSTINIIIDTNCSLRTNKLRMRTIISCILITVMKELGISFNLYVFCGRYKGVHVSMENRSVGEIISFVFDLEEVVKMPSTPLDLLTVPGQFNVRDPVVIVSDGFSEQLMSQNDEVKEVFKQYRKLFLLCVKGRGNDEALSGLNQSVLERSLKHNYGENMIIIERIDDIFNNSGRLIADVLFETQMIKMNSVTEVSQSTKWAQAFADDLKVTFEVEQSMVAINTISSTKSVRMEEISEEDLFTYQKPIDNKTVINKLSSVIQGENLFDAMSSYLFVPNKSTAFVASTSGTSIHMANYIKYVVSKTGDGKFFKKLGGEKIRSYNASIVIDCSSIAFSETNRVHSLITIFTFLRNLSNLQLPCIDLWVASSQIIRIATGITSMDLWENNFVAALYEYLLSPCQNTCLPDCIRYACCTCNARSLSSVMMVLTNGVLFDESRAEIKSIVSGIEMTYLGIGIGLYLCGFEDLFPTMIWNSNPNLEFKSNSIV